MNKRSRINIFIKVISLFLIEIIMYLIKSKFQLRGVVLLTIGMESLMILINASLVFVTFLTVRYAHKTYESSHNPKIIVIKMSTSYLKEKKYENIWEVDITNYGNGYLINHLY